MASVKPFLLLVALLQLQSFGVYSSPSYPYITECDFHDGELWLACGKEQSNDIAQRFQSPQVQCRSGPLELNRVQKVTFQNCEFATLPEKLLSHFSQLRVFDAEKTKLTTFRVEDLPIDRTNLREIRLADNEIEKIDADLLEAIQTVTEVDLSRNKIDELPQFNAASQLRKLDLSGNAIHLIAKDTFAEVTQLRVLILNDNKLQSATIHFSESNQLEILELANNEIGEVRVGDFLRLGHLKKLNLSHSQLTHIELGALAPITLQLVELDLSDNQFKEINFDGFLASMPNLQLLRLNGNQLTELDDDFSQLFPQLNELLVSGNKFNCTYLGQFVRSLDSRSAAVNANTNYEHNPNIRGIECHHVVKQQTDSTPESAPAGTTITITTPLQPTTPAVTTKAETEKHGFQSGYNVSIFILVLWISLTNLVICGVIVFLGRRAAAFQRN